MDKPQRKRSIWSLRRALIAIHSDLLDVDRYIISYSDYYPAYLTELERLVTVLEDRKFFSHKGVHLKAVIREILRALTFRRAHGASTIDMQFVRTATGYRKRTIRRKLYEMFLANILQYRYSKVTILRSYLAGAYLGWERRGMAQVATADFGVSADAIAGIDAARLAAHLVFPRPKTLTTIWDVKLLRRANYIHSFYVRHKKRFDKIERRVFP